MGRPRLMETLFISCLADSILLLDRIMKRHMDIHWDATGIHLSQRLTTLCYLGTILILGIGTGQTLLRCPHQRCDLPSAAGSSQLDLMRTCSWRQTPISPGLDDDGLAHRVPSAPNTACAYTDRVTV